MLIISGTLFFISENLPNLKMNMPIQHEYVFIDTQVLIYAFEKKLPAAIDLIKSELIDQNRCLVTSYNQLSELANTNSWLSALQLVSAVLNSNPMWATPFEVIQKLEIKKILNGKFFEEPKVLITPFLRSFNDSFNEKTDLIITPEEFTFVLWKEQNQTIRTMQTKHAVVLDALTAAKKNGKYTEEIDTAAMRKSISYLIPPSEFKKMKLTIDDYKQMIDYCIKNKKDVLKKCPSIGAEYHLSNFRTSYPKRKARISDSMDLFYGFQIFPYCSVFITNDRYLADGLEYARNKMSFNISIKRVNIK